MKEWQHDCGLIRVLALTERARRSPCSWRVRAFRVRVHRSAARRYPHIEQALHDLAPAPGLDAHDVTLPVRTRPIGLERSLDTGETRQPIVIASRQRAPARHDGRQSLQLLTTDRRLDVCHAVV